MLKIKIIIVFIFCFTACANSDDSVKNQTVKKSLSEIIFHINNPSEDYVLVVSHRGNWQVAPENSLESIQSCIDLGVDIVEIDVRKTMDGHLILMHDSDLDRTTNGNGNVSSKTLTEIKKLFLKDKYGKLTNSRVPTFEEAMLLSKDQIVVMVDKANDSFSLTHEILKETETVSQALFLEFYDYDEVIPAMSKSLFDNSLYVPRVKESKANPQKYLAPFIENEAADAIEIRFSSVNSHTLDVIPLIKDSGVSIWMTALSNDMVAGYTDQTSHINPDLGWGKCIEIGANIIMTDFPELMINYLKDKGLHGI
ncbi:glycerophosphodiester phosphodiesterase family protein [Flavobacteriaceae bacterium]|nr:glycerophosphodiester phosphodiesterase family protein [Flavobacteriaceae bacterium]